MNAYLLLERPAGVDPWWRASDDSRIARRINPHNPNVHRRLRPIFSSGEWESEGDSALLTPGPAGIIEAGIRRRRTAGSGQEAVLARVMAFARIRLASGGWNGPEALKGPGPLLRGVPSYLAARADDAGLKSPTVPDAGDGLRPSIPWKEAR